MTEQEFQQHADAALASLNRTLIAADHEVDFNGGVLTVEFDDPPAKFVVSPNTPPRQVWVSALTRSFKLDWDGSNFVHPDSGRTLEQLMLWAIGEHLS